MLDFDELRRSSAVAEEREEAFDTQVGKRRPALSEITPKQRFILSLMLFLNVLVLGCLCLLALNRVTLPF